ncbi:hypothetical protein MRX96_015414 [Rhipicephalus microplus]
MKSLLQAISLLSSEKPLLICHLVSPGYFARGSDRDEFLNQEVPSATICDYTLLDLPLLPDGTYEDASYNFMNSVRDHRLLFNADLDPTDANQSLVTARSVQFRNSIDLAQMDLHPNKIYGLGFIKGLPYLKNTGGGPETKAYLNDVYKYDTVYEILQIPSPKVNFTLTISLRLDGFYGVSLGSLATSSLNVTPVSFHNAVKLFCEKPLLICQVMSPGYFAPGDHRNEIASQELPSAAICDYTLLDLPIQPNGSYDDTSYTFISSAGYRLLFNVGLQGMGLSEILSVIQKGPFLQSVQTAQISVQPSKIYGLGFLKGLPILESGVGLLNDNALLRRTYMMFATYQWIKYPNTSTYVVGWTVYNVTRGLAPDKCLGPHNRIREIRKVIDENRYH